MSLAGSGQEARSQAAGDHPSCPIALVVPFPVGGTLDIVGRIAATEMSKTLGQQMVVEIAPARVVIWVRVGRRPMATPCC
jgi:tripartite-type tricarboxylate transporter receptor subunit TctC